MHARSFLLLSSIPVVVLVATAIGQTPERMPNMEQITQWARSGHSNIHSQAFAYWNDAGSIPPVCATCHSGAGFRALYGLDGSAPGLPQSPMPVGGVVDCDTCHHPGLPAITEIRLPSGNHHPVGGVEAACMTCHQGRGSGVAIDRAAGAGAEDEVNPQLGFINPHYAIAAASLLGGAGALGYQYPGKDYQQRFFHARPVSTCTGCHEPHELTVAEATCTSCHQTGNPRAIRISRQSFDGSGNLDQGIHTDIIVNRARLFALLTKYANEVSGTPILYDGSRHPYFYSDHNADGLPDQKDGAAVPYSSWTPRLLKAAYNWKFTGADAGIHVHNPHYALQLIFDSAEDISKAMGQELTGMSR